MPPSTASPFGSAPVELDAYKEALDLEKAINNTYKDRLTLLDLINDSNASMEKLLMDKKKQQEQAYKNIRDQNMVILSIERRLITANGDQVAIGEHLLKSAKDMLTVKKEEAKMLGEEYDSQINQIKEKQLEDNKWGNLVTKHAKAHFGFKVDEFDMMKSISEELESQPFGYKAIAGVVGGIVVLLAHAYKLFNQLDGAAAKFRKEMGLSRDSTKEIRYQAERLAIDFMHVGVTIEGAYEAVKALGAEMGTVRGISQELLTTTALLSSQYGIAEADTAAVLRNLAGMSGTSIQAQENTALFAASLSQAAGVPLPQVMKDVAHMSEVAMTMMSKAPLQIIKTAIEARKLNTTLNNMAEGSRKILDFTTNIQDEMEASVLLGKSINLQKARELAFQGEIEASNEEILNIAERINFRNLNTFQMEAFAKATGRSVEELTKMVVAKENWEALRSSTDPAIMAQVAAYDRIKNASRETYLTEVEKQKIFLQQESNQTRLAAITQKWNQLLAQATEWLLPIVDVLLSMVVVGIDFLKGVFAWGMALSTIGGTFSFVGDVIAVIVGRANMVSSVLAWIAAKASLIAKPFLGIVKFLGFFSKWIPILGWVITAFMFIGNLFQRLHGIGAEFKKGILHGIWFGIKAILLALYDTLLKPFYDVYLWVKKHLCGHSKSEIGDGILQGIIAIGGMLFNFLVNPFKLAFAGIKKFIIPLASTILKIGLFMFKWFTPMGLLIQGVKLLWNHFGSILPVLLKVGLFIFKWFNPIGLIIQGVKLLWNHFGSILPVLLKVGLFIFKWFNPIGLIIQGVKLLWNHFGEILSTAIKVGSFIFKWFTPMGLIIQGAKAIWEWFGPKLSVAIGGAINFLTGLWGNIKSGFDWISSIPEKLLTGILSIGEQMFDALTSPFKKGFNWIMDKIPGGSWLTNKLFGSNEQLDTTGNSVEAKSNNAYVTAAKVTPTGVKLEGTTAEKTTTTEADTKADTNFMSEETGQQMVSLLKKISAKNTTLTMDGSVLSTNLARSLNFNGSMGTNR